MERNNFVRTVSRSDMRFYSFSGSDIDWEPRIECFQVFVIALDKFSVIGDAGSGTLKLVSASIGREEMHSFW